MRQGFPGRVVGDIVGVEDAAENGGDVLRLAVGRGDQQHRRHLRQGRHDERAQRRRAGQVEGIDGTPTGVIDHLGEDGVGRDPGDESRQAHLIQPSGSPKTRPPVAQAASTRLRLPRAKARLATTVATSMVSAIGSAVLSLPD